MKKSHYFLFATVLFLNFISCKKDQLPIEKTSTLKEKVSSQDGILIFNDWETAHSTLNLLRNMSEKDVVAWEREHDFQSLASILDKSIVEDNNMFNSISQQYSHDELLELVKNDKIPQHSDYTLEQLKKGILEIKKSDDGSESIDLNCSAPYYARILNTNCIMVVNDTIYKYDDNTLKLITDGDFSKISSLSTTNSTNLNKKIIVAANKNINTSVFVIKTMPSDQVSQNYRRAQFWVKADRSTDGCYSATRYYIWIKCQRKDWWHGWIGDNMFVYIDGLYKWQQRIAGSSQLQTWEYRYTWNGSLASVSWIMTLPFNGINYDCRPLDPFYGDWDMTAQGGGVTLTGLYVVHGSVLGY